jgi:hypothetical protein
MIARRILKAFLVCLYATLAAAATAEDEKWKTVRTSAFGGYVISYDQPVGWTIGKESFERNAIQYRVGERGLPLNIREIYPTLKNFRQFNKRMGFKIPLRDRLDILFRIRQYNLPRPMTLDQRVAFTKGWKYNWYNGGRRYAEGRTKVMGEKAFFYLSSPKTIWMGGKTTPLTEPIRKTVIVVINDRVLFEIDMGVKLDPEHFKALQPTFDRMLKSIRATPVAKLDPTRISHALFTREVQLSEWRRFFLIVQASLISPPGWSASDPIIKQAVNGKPRGRLIVEIRQRKDPGGPSILLVLEGMPLRKPLAHADYLATGDRLIGKLMAKHSPGKTVKTASPAWSFCIPRFRSRYQKGTGKTALVRSFSGKDEKGRDVKARVYTMGGYTIACNLIFIAESKDFDKAFEKKQPVIEAIYKSINLYPRSSAFR